MHPGKIYAAGFGLVVAFILIIVGFSLANSPSDKVCTASVWESNLCDAAWVRQGIYGSALILTGFLVAAIIAAALILSPAVRRTSVRPAQNGEGKNASDAAPSHSTSPDDKVNPPKVSAPVD